MNHKKDFICTQDWDKTYLDNLLNLAIQMKKDKHHPLWQNSLAGKNFLMLFFSPSVRTHLSFLAAMTQLGGHAQYMTPAMGRFKSKNSPGEVIEDLARVMSGFVDGIGIRIMERDVNYYGEGNAIIRRYGECASVPVINMADDVCHPCQGLADILGWAEWFSGANAEVDFSTLQGKKLLLTWSKGNLARSWNSPQETLMLASRYGVNITIARPEGYDLDPEVYKTVEENLKPYNGQFEISDNHLAGYSNADIVYSRNWLSSSAYSQNEGNRDKEIANALTHTEWMTTSAKMALTNKAIFTHPMPIERNVEVESAVVDGAHSVVYQVAHNRLHVQKALLFTLLNKQ